MSISAKHYNIDAVIFPLKVTNRLEQNSADCYHQNDDIPDFTSAWMYLTGNIALQLCSW